MDYKRIYNSIIQNRLSCKYDGYTEKHHIIPKSLGGTDDPNNLVELSAREHFICHLLLTKIYENDTFAYHKMIKAFMMMLYCKSNNQQRQINSKTYSHLKQKFSYIQSVSQTGKLNSQYGKNKTEETKNKIRKSLLKKSNGLSKKDIKNLKKEKEKQELIKIHREYYVIYNKYGFDEFVKITGYDKTKQNLVKRFSKLLPEFKPQNGKRRGIKVFSPID